MTVFLAGALVGLLAGFPLGIRAGVPYARALRSWRDYRATIDAKRGLLRRTLRMWRKAVGQMAVVLLVLAGIVGLLYTLATAR